MLEPLPGAEMRKLKAAAQRLKATVHLGKAGLSPQFIAGVRQELARHELIKLKFDAFKKERKDLAKRIAEETSSHLIWMVGHVAVFYRKRPAAPLTPAAGVGRDSVEPRSDQQMISAGRRAPPTPNTYPRGEGEDRPERPLPSGSVPSIAFVCTANICRSPMAHAIFAAEAARRGLDVTVLSAGISDFEGMLAASEGRLTCERHQTPMQKFVATHVANVDLSGARRVFVMERSHISSLMATLALAPWRISLLGEFDPQQRGAEIDDPIGQDRVAFERCYERMRDCIIHYLDTTEDFNGAAG